MTTDQPMPAESLFAFEGEMTIYSAAANFQRLKERIGTRAPLHLDLSAVTEIDSSGLQLLLYAQSEADAHGLEFSVAGHSESIENVLSLLYLKRTFGVQTPPQSEVRA